VYRVAHEGLEAALKSSLEELLREIPPDVLQDSTLIEEVLPKIIKSQQRTLRSSMKLKKADLDLTTGNLKISGEARGVEYSTTIPLKSILQKLLIGGLAAYHWRHEVFAFFHSHTKCNYKEGKQAILETDRWAQIICTP
jgi:hypothetical protein